MRARTGRLSEIQSRSTSAAKMGVRDSLARQHVADPASIRCRRWQRRQRGYQSQLESVARTVSAINPFVTAWAQMPSCRRPVRRTSHP